MLSFKIRELPLQWFELPDQLEHLEKEGIEQGWEKFKIIWYFHEIDTYDKFKTDEKGEFLCDEIGLPIPAEDAKSIKIWQWTCAWKGTFKKSQYGQFMKIDSDEKGTIASDTVVATVRACLELSQEHLKKVKETSKILIEEGKLIGKDHEISK